MSQSKQVRELKAAARALSAAMGKLTFKSPVTHVYNPLVYAETVHDAYLERYGDGPKKVLFLGMNPGPFGMAQNGVPFGEIPAVRDWLGLDGKIGRPPAEHPKRAIEGFDCPKREVSGRRLWGFFAEEFDSAESFFAEHFVANYCPLLFLEESGRNRTPNKLPVAERKPLYAACDEHLRRVVAATRPQWVIGVGGFAEKRTRSALKGQDIHFGRILHPSPANPQANKDWAGSAKAQLHELGVWP